MYRTLCIAAFLVAASRSVSGQTAAHSACLHYEPDTVRLTGKLERHMYYGAPNFGEDPAHDEKEIGFYLEPSAPLCAGGGQKAELNEPHRGVRLVQLVLDSAGYARLQTFLGRQVTLGGTLFASTTGHHHTPVLLHVATPVHVERAH